MFLSQISRHIQSRAHRKPDPALLHNVRFFSTGAILVHNAGLVVPGSPPNRSFTFRATYFLSFTLPCLFYSISAYSLSLELPAADTTTVLLAMTELFG